ncbi:MAG: TonB-dependent receptor [Proteobacteria bacterium]|nr:TonB-dependent receptor [Pseudomonadota bacterium]
MAAAGQIALALAVATLAATGIAHAEEAAAEAAASRNDRPETLLVRAARLPLPASHSGSSASVLGREELERRQSASVGELLRSLPGVAMSRAGVVGSKSDLRLRGGEANHVLVFVDGVEANDPAGGGQFNFAHLLNSGIESVEVLRGPQSALWGSDALSGVVNIETRRAAPGFHSDVFAEGGSDAWRRFGGSLAYADERLNARLGIDRLATDGNNISRRGNEDDGYENLTTHLGLGYRLTGAFRVETALRYTDASNEFDAGSPPSDNDRETDSQRLYGRVAAHLDTLDGRWTHRFSYALTDTDNDNHSDGARNSSTAAKVKLAGYQTRFALTEEHALTAAFESQQEEWGQRAQASIFGDPNHDEEMRTRSWIFEYQGQPLSALWLQASLRRDDNSDFGDKSTGRVSAAWRVADRTKLRSAWGTGIKNPTFTERFGYYTHFIGNSRLEPEESRGWEVGVDQSLFGERLELSLTWFDERLEDEINGFAYDPVHGGFTAVNKPGESRRKGLELGGFWRLGQSLDLRFSYTRLDASEQDASGRQGDEIRRPEHVASANLNWISPARRVNLNLNIDYNGRQGDTDFSSWPSRPVELDDFTLVSVAGSYRLSDQWQLFARVENALDEDYEEIFGYVAPDRAVYAGIRYRFGER